MSFSLPKYHKMFILRVILPLYGMKMHVTFLLLYLESITHVKIRTSPFSIEVTDLHRSVESDGGRSTGSGDQIRCLIDVGRCEC